MSHEQERSTTPGSSLLVVFAGALLILLWGATSNDEPAAPPTSAAPPPAQTGGGPMPAARSPITTIAVACDGEVGTPVDAKVFHRAPSGEGRTWDTARLSVLTVACGDAWSERPAQRVLDAGPPSEFTLWITIEVENTGKRGFDWATSNFVVADDEDRQFPCWGRDDGDQVPYGTVVKLNPGEKRLGTLRTTLKPEVARRHLRVCFVSVLDPDTLQCRIAIKPAGDVRLGTRWESLASFGREF